MGNGMRKYSHCGDGYYKRRRMVNDGNNANYSKDYCEYWKSDNKSRGSKDDTFAIERNDFAFSTSQPANSFDSPLRASHKNNCTFISSFDNSKNFSKSTTCRR